MDDVRDETITMSDRFSAAALLLPFALLAFGCGPPPVKPSSVRLEPGPVDADAPEEFTETESGLKYRIRRKSEGAKPGPKDSVRVHYRGWLDGGRVFDSTYGMHAGSFTVDGVVPGFSEGLQLIGVGGMVELEIPPDIGYGDLGNPPRVPPNATLHFLLELEEVTPGLPE